MMPIVTWGNSIRVREDSGHSALLLQIKLQMLMPVEMQRLAQLQGSRTGFPLEQNCTCLPHENERQQPGQTKFLAKWLCSEAACLASPPQFSPL